MKVFRVPSNPARICYMGPSERSSLYTHNRNILLAAKKLKHTHAQVGVRLLDIDKAIREYDKKAQHAVGFAHDVPVATPKIINHIAKNLEIYV